MGLIWTQPPRNGGTLELALVSLASAAFWALAGFVAALALNPLLRPTKTALPFSREGSATAILFNISLIGAVALKFAGLPLWGAILGLMPISTVMRGGDRKMVR